MTSARDQQIRALYRAALERPPAERASFVAELTGDDAELRKSVELMLSGDGATHVGERVVQKTEPAPELAVGTMVGQYRIDGVVGRGGMGVVYRATDTKLHRPVAIKFLSSVLADADARRRFKQEAETTSGLNHPHIVTVHDVGEHDGSEYIVSELVDGGTLDDWSAKARKRSWRQSVELLTGVADALAAAHAAGVLHRDVKPGNILIGSNGYAKLADFGLAKLVDVGPHDPSAGARSGATRNTRAGVVIGTVAYMSPEQAAGLAVDARSDVFSFGVVLYELIAGRRPFEAANDLELLKSIAHAAPAPLPDNVPELLRMAVDKALEKEPADRYQTMRDFVADLKRVARKPGVGAASSNAGAARGSRAPWLVAAGLAVALAAALVAVTRAVLRPSPSAPLRADVAFPVRGYLRGLALSPDGTQIVYVRSVDGVAQIAIRPIGALEARVLAGTENAANPFWSADSRSLAFSVVNKLKRIDTTGGPAQALADNVFPVEGFQSGTWNRDGTILYPTAGPQIGRVSAKGGAPANLAKTAAPSVDQVFPRFLPDGRHFLFVAGKLASASSLTLYAASLDAPTGVPVMSIDTPLSAYASFDVAYASGFLLYLNAGTLFAQPFDLDTLKLSGQATPVAGNVADFSVADDGPLVYRTSSAAGADGPPARDRHLVWVSREGRRLGEVDPPPGFTGLALAPDGQHLAVMARFGNSPVSGIWTLDSQAGPPARLTFGDASDASPIWSPDGTRVAFSSARDGGSGSLPSIYLHAASGAGSDELLMKRGPDEIVLPVDWSHDGRFILFVRALRSSITRSDLWVLPMTGDRTAYPLIESPFQKKPARLSPDGRWIAYDTNESGSCQIVVRPFPSIGEGQWQVTTRGGYEPRWRGDGRELYYITADGDLMAVEIRAADAFEASAPRKLFSTGYSVTNTCEGLLNSFYAVAADGERFLINEPLPGDTASTAARPAPDELIHLVVNWTSGLRAK